MSPLRVLIGTLGLDQHEVGAQVIARWLRDAGMEVIYLGRFNLPEKFVKAAIEENADVVGVSCHSWEYLHYIEELLALQKEAGLGIPVVVGGSVITPGDERLLLEKGVTAVFGPMSVADDIPDAIRRVARNAR